MLQDNPEYKYDNSYKIKKPALNDYGLYFDDNQMLLSYNNNEILLPKFFQLAQASNTKAEYLFSMGENNFFLLEDTAMPCINGFEMKSVGIFKEAEPQWLSFAAITAWQYYRFREENKFCGKCGNKLIKSTAEKAYICTTCDRTVYPKFSPAILAVVLHEDKILLVKSKHYSHAFSPVAGFVEVGESFEQTVAREVLEETGVKVKNICYYGSQPWSFGDTIMIAYTAELDGEDTITIQADEICDAGWFTRENIPPGNGSRSLGGNMIESFRRGGPNRHEVPQGGGLGPPP
ncbi:MAG: NAD(+) diphosphatase, partial [Oscillospiraceae bacterium]